MSEETTRAKSRRTTRRENGKAERDGRSTKKAIARGRVATSPDRATRGGRDGKHEGAGVKPVAGRDGALPVAEVRRFDAAFAAEPRNRLALNAVTAGKSQVVARNRDAVVRAAQRTFSHVVKTPEITNQRQSGRCWMFAGLNVLRVEAMKKLKVDQFEFSQTYLQFYDKLEKA
ncbi:MAG TPA: C1 family peptidase, partial [Thermoleophilia bacterium]|nr:C1 family peptidase [Thermoleophilia bacterium]